MAWKGFIARERGDDHITMSMQTSQEGSRHENRQDKQEQIVPLTLKWSLNMLALSIRVWKLCESSSTAVAVTRCQPNWTLKGDVGAACWTAPSTAIIRTPNEAMSFGRKVFIPLVEFRDLLHISLHGLICWIVDVVIAAWCSSAYLRSERAPVTVGVICFCMLASCCAAFVFVNLSLYQL